MKPAHELKKERAKRVECEQKRMISELVIKHKDKIDRIYTVLEDLGICVVLKDDFNPLKLSPNDLFDICQVFHHYGYRANRIRGLDSTIRYAVISVN